MQKPKFRICLLCTLQHDLKKRNGILLFNQILFLLIKIILWTYFLIYPTNRVFFCLRVILFVFGFYFYQSISTPCLCKQAQCDFVVLCRFIYIVKKKIFQIPKSIFIIEKKKKSQSNKLFRGILQGFVLFRKNSKWQSKSLFTFLLLFSNLIGSPLFSDEPIRRIRFLCKQSIAARSNNLLFTSQNKSIIDRRAKWSYKPIIVGISLTFFSSFSLHCVQLYCMT